tara:strand:+ start:447 stop:1313 length:867 start_codon:yes stop_codon:yes gene_type:complete
MHCNKACGLFCKWCCKDKNLHLSALSCQFSQNVDKDAWRKCINCDKACKRSFESVQGNSVLSLHWSCQGALDINKGVAKTFTGEFVVQCRGTVAKQTVNAIKAVLKEYCNNFIHKKAYKEVAKHHMEKYALVYYSSGWSTYFVPSLRRYIDVMCITVRELILDQVYTVGLIFNASTRVRGLPRLKTTKTGKRRKIRIPIFNFTFPSEVVNKIYDFAFPNVLPSVHISYNAWFMMYNSVVERVAKVMLNFHMLKDYGYRQKMLKQKCRENVMKECKKHLFIKKGKFRFL